MIIKYIRDDTNRPIGVVVSLGDGSLGWSLCNPKDMWNKALGRKIALSRASSGIDWIAVIRKMDDRAYAKMKRIVFPELMIMMNSYLKYIKAV